MCADLARLQYEPLLDGDNRPVEDLVLPDLDRWLSALRASPLVLSVRGEDGASPRPLVMEESGRLYLARYWSYQERLASALLRRAAALEPVDAEAMRASLERLFPQTSKDLDLQRVAAVVAAQRRLTVISGASFV